VKKGDVLFRLRDAVTLAELDVRKKSLDASKTKLEKLAKMPRPEDIPPATAKVAEATADVQQAEETLADIKSQLALWETVTVKGAISQDDLDRKRFAVRINEAKVTSAKAKLQSAQADLALL